MEIRVNNTKLSDAITSLRRAIAGEDEQDMYLKAHQLDAVFCQEVSDSLTDYNSALARFECASAMIDFFIRTEQEAQAGSLRNRIIAHYQVIRKSTSYTVEQKHILKQILQGIKDKTRFPKREKFDSSFEDTKRSVFILRAYRWFEQRHGMLPLEAMNYLRPYKVEPFLYTLPLDMPKAQVVEEMTRFCYERGGSLPPRALQKHYRVAGKQAKHLYIVGNGFDRYHGAESGYNNFRRYLYRQSPLTVGYFDLYFGPRSLERSFSTPLGWWWCLQPYEYRHIEYGLRYPVATWSRSNLWCDFETNLSELNREKVFDLLDMQLPRVDEGEEGFRYSDYYLPIDEIGAAVQSCTTEMKYHFHRWINTLHYAKGFRKRMLPLDRDALFLSFNYTLFLESEYEIPAEQICYIHGNRKDKFGSLVLGHHSNDQEAFERWKHKNQNRRRYRHVQKDSKGRYFRNDKLAYLAFFHKDDWTGNWRLPIRYYAVEEAEDKLEGYYEKNFKNTRSIIDAHMGFFDSLSEIEIITVIGCSLGAVDMDYYRQLKQSVQDDTQWEFSYHSTKDLMRIKNFCQEMKIKDGRFSTFEL